MNCKHLLSLSLLCLSAVAATAQGITQQASAGGQLTKHRHLFMENYSKTAKATATASRLYANTFLQYDSTQFFPLDSAWYAYSGNRGGDLTTRDLAYDYGYYYLYNEAPGTYTLDNKTDQTFDANNNVLMSTIQSYNAATSTYTNWMRDTYTYDGNNNRLTDVYQQWDNTAGAWVNSSQYVYTYNSNNDTTSQTYQYWTNNAWVNSNRNLYVYTGANRHDTDTYQDWSSSGSTWNTVTYTTYGYDGNNNETSSTVTAVNGIGGVPVYSTRALSVYSNNMLQTTTNQTWNENTSAWVNYTKDSFSNYSGSSPQTLIEQAWNAMYSTWNNDVEILYTYNSYGQTTTMTQLLWVAPNVSAYWALTDDSYERHLYYEDYNTLSVSSVSQKGGSASVYPVPAQTGLQIDLSWDNAQDATITIYDMQGRLFRQFQTGNAAQYHKTLNVTDLAAGNYIINISGERGAIVKQLTVTH